MKVEGVDVEAAIANVQALLEQEQGLSPALKSALEVILLLVSLLLNRATLNSTNSSKPPSTDPNRKKPAKARATVRKPGGQKGHVGTTLMPVVDPDEIMALSIDRRTLPTGRQYHEVGYDKRQVIDIDIARVVTEYQAQILEDDLGNRFVADFPKGVNRSVQYGLKLKAHAVYMSQFQLVPYDRIRDHFADQMNIPLSAGSLYRFNQSASAGLGHFSHWAKEQLSKGLLIHADETGVNINAKGHWLHCASNASLTWLEPHQKRGKEAFDDIGILPYFKGVLCHDHWKPYYQYQCTHALCNAHHLRELERAFEQDGQQWAKQMQVMLLDINTAVTDAGGCLPADPAKRWTQRYRQLLENADRECPPPDTPRRKGQKGRLKRSKARNLLERLRNFEEDVLRFMHEPSVPFTNNQGENDLRMTKVQQKISGCFRSLEGAKIFCLIRSYLSTCRKNGVSASRALTMLFEGKHPEFMTID